jgi:hypothetical protein
MREVKLSRSSGVELKNDFAIHISVGLRLYSVSLDGIDAILCYDPFPNCLLFEPILDFDISKRCH